MGSNQSTDQETEEQQRGSASEADHDPTADPIFLTSSFISAYKAGGPDASETASRQFTTPGQKNSIRQHGRKSPDVPEFVFPKYHYGDESERHPKMDEDAVDAAACTSEQQEEMELEIEERLTERFYEMQLKIARQQLEKLEMKLQKVMPHSTKECVEQQAALLDCLRQPPVDAKEDNDNNLLHPLLRCRDSVASFSKCVSSAAEATTSTD